MFLDSWKRSEQYFFLLDVTIILLNLVNVYVTAKYHCVLYYIHESFVPS